MRPIRCPKCHTLNAKLEGNKVVLLVGYGKRRRFIIFNPEGASLECLECKSVFHLDERRQNESSRKRTDVIGKSTIVKREPIVSNAS